MVKYVLSSLIMIGCLLMGTYNFFSAELTPLLQLLNGFGMLCFLILFFGQVKLLIGLRKNANQRKD